MTTRTGLMQAFSLRRNALQPRVFQQACRLATASTRRIIARNKKLIESQQAERRSRWKNTLPQDEEEEAIRWFEQDVETGATRRVQGNPEELEADELRRKIGALEKELREYRNQESDEDLLAALEPHERAKVEKALKEKNKAEEQITSGLNVSLEMPPLTVPLLKRFNAALRDAALSPTMITRRKDLWRWYGRAKHSIPGFTMLIPEKAWQMLWKTQSFDSPTNPDRLEHMEQLLLDMATINLEIMPDQSLVFVETLLAQAKVDDAIARWQQAYQATSKPTEGLLSLGVKLFAENRQLEKAHSTMLQLFDLFPTHDPRIIVPILSAQLVAGNDQLAFGCYILMSQKLGEAMKMEDYDVITLTFLEYDKKDFALAVFRDMMLRGPNKELKDDFLNDGHRNELYDSVMKRMKVLTDHAKDATELNLVSLETLSVLPKAWQNKFFYGSWLKKLIGMRQLQAATKVVELMYERGIQPDPRHINGLIGGFFRTGEKHLTERGEQMAWTMIQQRLDYAYRERQIRRGEALESVPSVRTTTEEGVEIPAHLARPVPRATMETFNVLALHYSINEKWAYIHHLDRMRRPAQFKMDSAFFNHMLNLWFNNRDGVTMWQCFIKQAKHTAPDMETYNILWTAQIEHLNPKKNRDRRGFPTPRQLFALMTTWLSRYSEFKQGLLVQEFTPEIYAKIVSSFCLNKDFAGCLVALHAIARTYKEFPDPDIARIIMTGVANMGESQPPSIRGRRGRQQLPTSAVRLKNVSKIMATVAEKRAKAALELGIDITALDPPAAKEESLNLMSEFIRLLLVRVHGDADAAEASIAEAAGAMQLGDLSTGDKDCSNVV